MIVFDSNRSVKWAGRGFAINKSSVVAYKNANFRHTIDLKKGSYDLRLFSRNRTGSSPLLFKIVTDKSKLIFSGKIVLSKIWSDDKFKFEIDKNYGAGFLYIYRDDSSYGSVELGRIVLEKDEFVMKVKTSKNRIRGSLRQEEPISIPVVKKYIKRKIGFVIPYTIYGGAEVYLETIINNIDSNMFQIHIIYTKDNPLRFTLANKAVIHKKSSSSQNLVNYIKHQKLDFLVYYNSISSYRLCQKAQSESSNLMKLIEIYHSDFKWADSLSSLKKRNNVDIAFKISPNYLKNVSGIKNLVNLPVPINTNKFLIRDVDEVKNIKLSIPNDKKIVGVVARLSAEKNLDYVLDLAKVGTDFNFLIFGEGNREQHLKHRVAKEKIKNVHFMGFKKDVFRYYGIFDAFLLTSKMEGTPISILEAMASGVPVFTTNVGEINTIVKDKKTGFFLSSIPAQDIKLIKDNIFDQEVILRAKKYVEEAHDQKIITAKFINSIIDVHNQFVRKEDINVLLGEYI